MKKYLTLLIVLVCLVPYLALASWWNPFSWFNNWSLSNKSEENIQALEKKIEELESRLDVSTTTLINTKFYVKYDNARIRSCPSTDCKIAGYYDKTSEITLSDTTPLKLDDLPEWVQFISADGIQGFVNKSVLSETPVSPSINQNNQTQETNTSDYNSKNDVAVIDFIDSTIQILQKEIKYTTFLKDSISEIIDSTKEKKELLESGYSDTFNNLIILEDQSISKFQIYKQGFDNAISFLDFLLSETIKIRNDFKNQNRLYDNPTYLTLLVKFNNDSNETMGAIENNWREFEEYYKSSYSNKQLLMEQIRKNSNENKTSSSPIILYSHSTEIPTIQPISFPKQNQCRISPIGGGGVDLIVTCY